MPPLIELTEITKDYGSFRALDHVSLTIDSGVTGLLGPNGAGKTTLIKVLLGLVRTTSGRGRLLNFEIGRDARAIRAHVGYMPEDDCYLHGMTGVECVQFVAQLSQMKPTEALRRAHEILDDPPVLILDEPTSGLDPEERQIMLNRIRLLARDHGKAVLICTHILPDVQSISDSVVILAGGRVQVSQKLAELTRPAVPALEIRLLGEPTRFLNTMRSRGVPLEERSNGSLLLHGDPAVLADDVWKLASECGVGVRSLTPSRNSLEEIFLNAVRGETHLV